MKNKYVLYGLYVIVIALLVYVGWTTKLFGVIKEKSGETSKDGQWQAVFLTNGQVYFGKLSGAGNQFATMKEIYYLQVQKPVQPAQEGDQNQSKVTLVKLGSEMHKPMDEMKINRDQMLFWENLKADGKVVQAIDKYRKEGPTPTTSPSPAK